MWEILKNCEGYGPQGNGVPEYIMYKYMHMSRIYEDFTEEEKSFYAICASFFLYL